MKDKYVKTLLYSYPKIKNLRNMLDKMVLKKTLGARTVYSSCQEQCEQILALTQEKAVISQVGYYVKKIHSRLSREKKILLDYKYFRFKPLKFFAGVDLSSRNYFRKQQKLICEIGQYFEWMGIDDEWFEKIALKSSFIGKLLSVVESNDCKHYNLANAKVCKRGKEAA